MKQIIRRVAALVVGLGLGVAALAGLESVTHISDLNASWPLGSDLASTSDDHIRNIKSALKTDFPNVNAAVNPTPAQFNQLTSNTFTTAVTGNSFIPSSSTVPTNGIYLPAANTLGFASNSTKWGSVNSTGNWVLVAPSSGTPLTINGTSGGAGFLNALVNTANPITADFQNTSTGTTAYTAARFFNSTDGLYVGMTSTGYSGAFFTGGATGEVGIFGTANNVPLSIATNNTERIRITGGGIVQYTSSTQPFFNAQRITSTQTITNSAVVDMVFNSTNTQNGGTNYSTSTGVFTAPVAGIYIFNGMIEATTSGGLTNSVNAIYYSKNNATAVGASRYEWNLTQVPQGFGTGLTVRWAGSVTLSLAANDTVRIKIDNGAGTGGTIVMNIGSWFTGYLLG